MAKKAKPRRLRTNRGLRQRLAPHQPSLSSRVRVSTKIRDSRLGPARQWLQVRRQMNASNRGRVSKKARNSRTHRAYRLLQILPNPLNKARARKTKGALNMANRRLFRAEQSLHEIRMRIWKTKTILKAQNIKGTSTTKSSPGRRMRVAELLAAANVVSKFNLKVRRHRVDNTASGAGNRVARVRERKGKLPQLRLRGN